MQKEVDAKEPYGLHNARLFLFAMEECGCGPPRGMMNLDDYEGASAFLRAVQYHLSLKYTFDPYLSMDGHMRTHSLTDDMTAGKEFKATSFDGVLETERNIKLCKVSVNPLMIFLHVDQGCFDQVGYTPFASLMANNRSIHQHHVNKVVEQVKNGNPIISQEDFALVAFDVIRDDVGMDTADSQGPIPYRCTLNRDRQSRVTVMGKKASEATCENLDILYKKVSSTTVHCKDTVGVFAPGSLMTSTLFFL